MHLYLSMLKLTLMIVTMRLIQLAGHIIPLTIRESLMMRAWAWLTSGPPGPCGADPIVFFWHSLDDWKAGPVSNEANGKIIDGNTRIIALEIEVDGWIAESEAFIDDITLNGNVIENFDDQNIQVRINEDIKLSISPLTLDFGALMPGMIDSAGPPVTFDATGSNVDVSVTVSTVIGFPFDTGLKFNGAAPGGQSALLPCVIQSDVCTYTTIDWTTSLSIPSGTPPGLLSGTIVYSISGPTP